MRSFSKNQTKDFLTVEGERFEYETNMIISNKDLGYRFKEIPIKTIYIENNRTSHFNPIYDSVSIYSVFLKYIVVSILSFILDITLFKIFIVLNFSILFSTAAARAFSSIINYILNRNKVFKSFDRSNFLKYYILVAIQILVSGFSLKLLSVLFANRGIIILKILVDIIIFILNYYIQREWVFKEGER